MATEFTPIAALLGGALIGLAAVFLMGGLGRVMGATGILAGALTRSGQRERGWRFAVLLGMFTAPSIYFAIAGAAPVIQTPVGTPALLIGGLLVGVGVTLGSGCTSGHGVCGLARLSPRSLAAVLTFMSATTLTVFIARHVMAN